MRSADPGEHSASGKAIFSTYGVDAAVELLSPYVGSNRYKGVFFHEASDVKFGGLFHRHILQWLRLFQHPKTGSLELGVLFRYQRLVALEHVRVAVEHGANGAIDVVQGHIVKAIMKGR